MSLTIEQKEIIDEWVELILSVPGTGITRVDIARSLVDPYSYLVGNLEGFIVSKLGREMLLTNLNLEEVRKHIEGENQYEIH